MSSLTTIAARARRGYSDRSTRPSVRCYSLCVLGWAPSWLSLGARPRAPARRFVNVRCTRYYGLGYHHARMFARFRSITRFFSLIVLLCGLMLSSKVRKEGRLHCLDDFEQSNNTAMLVPNTNTRALCTTLAMMKAPLRPGTRPVGAAQRAVKDMSTNGAVFAATPKGDGPRPQDWRGRRRRRIAGEHCHTSSSWRGGVRVSRPF